MRLVWYAYFFLVDFIVNVLFTALFATIWFMIISKADEQKIAGAPVEAVKSAAGLPHPLHPDVTKVHVIATPNDNPLTGQHGKLIGQTGSMSANPEGSMLSAMFIIFFWLVKIYFTLLVFAYARSLVIRAGITSMSFSLETSFWGNLQRRMLQGEYWRQDDEDYKQNTVR
jgi:Inositolphosphorylceramide synthase subunit Kei1